MSDRLPVASAFGARRDGEPALLYTLENANGLRAAVTTHGATLVSLWAPGRDGVLADVTLGFDDVSGYESPANDWFGCTVGRWANRIRGARFTLDGRTYAVTPNDGLDHLHGGGARAFANVPWRARPFARAGERGVTFAHRSHDGDEGFPGTLDVEVTYALTDRDELRIDYRATTDRPTVINLTNHAYWNLAGAGSGDVLDHVLELLASRMTPIDDALLPTGEIAPVAGTPFDFRTPRRIGERMPAPDAPGHGYDHNFVLDGPAGELQPAARVVHPPSGRALEIHTTQPGLQLYSGNFLRGQRGKGGVAYQRRSALCLETQHFPDSPNQPGFPSTVLRPERVYRERTVHHFGVAPQRGRAPL
jgi:aldose 1-epimerase